MGAGSVYPKARLSPLNGPVSPPFQLVPQGPAPLHHPGSTPCPLTVPSPPPSPSPSPPSRFPRAGTRPRRDAPHKQRCLESPGSPGHPRGGARLRDLGNSAHPQRLTCCRAGRRRGEPAPAAERKSRRWLARPPGEAAPGGAPWRWDAVPARSSRTRTWARAPGHAHLGTRTWARAPGGGTSGAADAHALMGPTWASLVLSPCWTQTHLGPHCIRYVPKRPPAPPTSSTLPTHV